MIFYFKIGFKLGFFKLYPRSTHVNWVVYFDFGRMTDSNEAEQLKRSGNEPRDSQDSQEFAQTVRKFESAYVRVPFEQFRRAFRLEMRLAEKDLPGLEVLFKKHLSEGGTVPENVLKALRERVKGLEDRLREYRGESKKFRERFLKRMKWTETMAAQGNYRNWSRGRLIRLIGDFLLRKGEIGLVREIGQNKPELSEEFDMELEEMRGGIIASLKGKDLGPVLQWCVDHRNNLKRIGSDLEFRLRRQEFIELLRTGDLETALKCSQKHFPQWLETNYPEIRESLALVCWLPFIGRGLKWSNGRMSKYENLFNESMQWQNLRERFESDFISVYQVDEGSQLVKTVRIGLSALKTQKCREIANSEESGLGSRGSEQLECPVCRGPLKDLAKQLPFGHFEQTKLRCRITGRLMSENDPPMALPNGQVYSESGVKFLVGWQDGGTVLKCPETGQQFLISEARKCFFL